MTTKSAINNWGEVFVGNQLTKGEEENKQIDGAGAGVFCVGVFWP